MNRTRRRAAAMAMGSLVALAGLLAPAVTSAGYTDSTYAKTTVATAAVPDTVHTASDLSSASALELTADGELYVTGYRGTGDGNGSTSVAPTADPTLVKFPRGVRILDAGGSTNDFSETTFPATTSFMALDDAGRVWTWGTPYPTGSAGAKLIGRGNISVQDAARAGQVTQTVAGQTLPPIVSIARIENQFLALDESGTLWAWGYGGENLPYSGGAKSQPLPFPVRATSDEMGNLACDRDSGSRRNAGEVVWHSIWGGANGASAVGRDGLVYSWGFDTSTGVPGSRYDHTRCPAPNEGANRALFQRYPDLYRTADGRTYDEAELGSEKERSQRYRDIVAALRGKTLPVCDGSQGVSQVDASGCPVRQFGVDARHYRLLTKDGELLTWMTGRSNNYGDKFLGRTPTAEQPEEAPAPIAGGFAVDRVVAGVSSVVALSTDGVAYGWGDNNACQAVGAPTEHGNIAGGSCANAAPRGTDRYRVTLPTPVADLPEGARVTGITSASCSTWVSYADGASYAWGAGTASGYAFNECRIPGKRVAGYKIYLVGEATPKQPFGRPVSDPATGTARVK